MSKNSFVPVLLLSEVGSKRGSGPILTIKANNNKKKNAYVKSVSWNGELIDRNVNFISYSALRKGGVLEFEMTDIPY